jgi:hypothetical protein
VSRAHVEREARDHRDDRYPAEPEADLDGGGAELKLSYRVITNRSVETKPWQRTNTDARGDSNYLHGGSNDPAAFFLPGRILEPEEKVTVTGVTCLCALAVQSRQGLN